MRELIVSYWVEWLFGIVAMGIAAFAKHYISLQKKDFQIRQKEQEGKIKDEIIGEFKEEISREAEKSQQEDKRISADIDALYLGIENLETGILSIQGKQFREFCIELLEQDHEITIQEYEQFEEDYSAYKALGGNHRGDALHDLVVEKFKNQISK